MVLLSGKRKAFPVERGGRSRRKNNSIRSGKAQRDDGSEARKLKNHVSKSTKGRKRGRRFPQGKKGGLHKRGGGIKNKKIKFLHIKAVFKREAWFPTQLEGKGSNLHSGGGGGGIFGKEIKNLVP